MSPFRLLPALVATLVVAGALTPAPRAQTRLVAPGGALRVELTPAGALDVVDGGVLTVLHGPQAPLSGDVAEWVSLGWRAPDGSLDLGAAGSAPDWCEVGGASRPALATDPPREDGRDVVARARHGALVLETRLGFGDRNGDLVGAMTVRNEGDRDLVDVVLTREWAEPGRAGSSAGPRVEGLPPVARGVHRAVWHVPHLAAGAAHQVALRYRPIATHGGTVDVPLTLFQSPNWPGGIVLLGSNGVSWGDADTDGHPDILVVGSGLIFLNDGAGDFQSVALNVNYALPSTTLRYGGSFADFDNDGDQDFGTEPRNMPGGDTKFHLLENQGTGTFVDIAGLPFFLDVQPTGADSETICWGDVDGDGDLDLFLPVYPPWSAIPSIGNFFFTNTGPSPFGSWVFEESTSAAGLDNPPGTARPEGAQLCDVDDDGDLDLFSNMTLYRNVSSVGSPLFEVMTTAAIGVDATGSLDEGAAFFDYDRDGDLDLLLANIEPALGVRVWESRGDGTYFLAPGVVQSPNTGLGLGLSYADWDNDGDIDLTTRYEFRRNQLVETGQRQFTVASHGIFPPFVSDATPAWCDFDRDGDLDAAIGNYFSDGRMFLNATYDAATPAADRRYVRVRPVRDSLSVDAGLDNEYGARVELFLAGEEDGPRRVGFTASGHGYLNQNEYTLHFALPDDPTPGDPLTDVVFDVVVDFPSLPSQGYVRVDRDVNPALGGIGLATLTDRELKVYRSGRVVIDGVDAPPAAGVSTFVTTTGGGLVSAPTGAALPAPTAAASGTWVGVELDTHGAIQPQRVRELLLDGALDAPVACGPGDPANVVLFEVGAVDGPVAVAHASRTTDPRNHRSRLAVDLELLPGRTYRLMARVQASRTTTIAGPVDHGAVVLAGGVTAVLPGPCDAVGVAAAPLDPTGVSMAVRYRELPAAWVDLGNGRAGTNGVPSLSGSGTPSAGQSITVSIDDGLASSPALLIYGTSSVYLPIAGAVLVPLPQVTVGGLTTDAGGSVSVGGTWIAPPGAELYLQGAVIDPGAPDGLAVTNGLLVIGQP